MKSEISIKSERIDEIIKVKEELIEKFVKKGAYKLAEVL